MSSVIKPRIDYRTVQSVNGPLVILDHVKVYLFKFVFEFFYFMVSFQDQMKLLTLHWEMAKEDLEKFWRLVGVRL
jgi:hypothetical protein